MQKNEESHAKVTKGLKGGALNKLKNRPVFLCLPLLGLSFSRKKCNNMGSVIFEIAEKKKRFVLMKNAEIPICEKQLF